MNHYYLNRNKQPKYEGGNYELHKSTCPYYYKYLNGNNFIYIGYFASDIDAFKACCNKYPSNAHEIDGCAYCCPNIHKN